MQHKNFEIEILELKYKNNDYFEFETKITSTNQKYIYLTYYPKTNINEFSNPIKFQISLIPTSENNIPIVNIINTFVYPSLYDNRDLLEDILSRHLCPYDPSLMIIIEVIENIPRFIKKLSFNIKKYLCVYYGKYYFDKIYYMNDFIENEYMKFYKVYFYPYNKKKEKRRMYLILTDIYILLFEITNYDDYKNFGKLINKYEIISIKNYRTDEYHKGRKKYSVVLIFNNSEISLEIVLENETNDNFLSLLNKKIKWLKERYKTFKEEKINTKNGITNLLSHK